MEQYEAYLMSLEDCDDKAFQTEACLLIKKYIMLNIRERLKSFGSLREFSSESGIDRSASGEIFRPAEDLETQRRLRSFTQEYTINRSICKLYTDEPEEYERIKTIFIYLYHKHKNGQGARMYESQIEIHSSNIRQLFLDCQVKTQQFLNLLCAPLRNKDWVDISMFTMCIEAVQQLAFDQSLFFREQNSEFKKQLTLQKLMCNIYAVFFKLVDVSGIGSLNREELKIVLSMALRKRNEITHDKLDSMVSQTFARVEELSGRAKDRLTLSELLRILM